LAVENQVLLNKITMRHLKLLIINLVVTMLSSCSWETKSESSSTLTYSGKIAFSDDKSRITSISPHGFLIYKNDDGELQAGTDLHGRVIYQVNGGDKKYSLNDKGKSLFDQVMQQLLSDSTIKNKPYVINDTQK